MGARAAIRISISLTACRSFLAGIIAAGLIKIPNPYAAGAAALAVDVVVSLGVYYFAEVKEYGGKTAIEWVKDWFYEEFFE